MTNSNLHMCKIGDRIESCGFFGTVKYVGQIEGKPSLWLGIDWDDVHRGKHNGSVDGVQYFTTRHPTSGSFLRPEKVNTGKTVASAIESRYGEAEDDLTAKRNQQKQLLIQRSMNAPFLEMVGFEKVFSKQSNFRMLRVVNLRAQNVNSVGSAEQLASQCPNVEELDLSRNLFSNWDVVFDLCAHLKNLRLINVSENVMTIPENYAEHTYLQVEMLICGRMGLTWADIIKISNVFPNMKECISPFNNINSVDVVESTFKTLKCLDLEGNPMKRWSEVVKLDSIKTLEQLNLENIGLDSIAFNENGQYVSCFENLRKLCIVNNKINEWKSVNELNRLKSLEHLKISKNPIFESESIETAFQVVIARIANLKLLNGVEIYPNERRGAEYDYIKKYGLEWLKIKGTDKQQEFLETHGRYLELIEKYGEPEEAELIIKPKVIKSSLIQLNFESNEKTITKKLPPSITIQKLIIMLQKLFSMSNRPTLTYISSVDKNIEIELDDELKEIGVYSMQDGDKILVKE